MEVHHLFMFITIQAEQTIESHRKDDYVKSVINDVKTDTSRLGKNIRVFQLANQRQDSFMRSFTKLFGGYSSELHRLQTLSLSGFPDFIQTDGTIQQLKNSGGFRLMGKEY